MNVANGLGYWFPMVAVLRGEGASNMRTEFHSQQCTLSIIHTQTFVVGLLTLLCYISRSRIILLCLWVVIGVVDLLKLS